MKVRLNTIMAGPGGCYDRGREVDLPEPQAIDLIRTGQAEQVSGAGVQVPGKSKKPPAAGATGGSSVSASSAPLSQGGAGGGSPPAETGNTGAAGAENTTPPIPLVSLEDLGVPTKARKVLQSEGLENSHDVWLLRDDLTAIDGIGESTAKMIRELLDDLSPNEGEKDPADSEEETE